MSDAVRNELATAANTVDGVNVSPYYRQSTKPGSGVVQLERIEYPNTFGGEAYWQLIVLLPTGIEAAQKRSEVLIPLLYNALRDHLVVTLAELGQTVLDTSGAAQPCVLISGHREQEN